jgi:hypothetical protein
VKTTLTTGPSSTGLPYVQLLACKKVGAPAPKKIVVGTTAFFETATCPDGWSQTEETQGRFVVGLPPDAPADQTFGGAPLGAGEDRPHGHVALGTLVTKPHGLAVLSGCCAGGYAKNRTYDALGVANPGSPALPTLSLTSCTKS